MNITNIYRQKKQYKTTQKQTNNIKTLRQKKTFFILYNTTLYLRIVL